MPERSCVCLLLLAPFWLLGTLLVLLLVLGGLLWKGVP